MTAHRPINTLETIEEAGGLESKDTTKRGKAEALAALGFHVFRTVCKGDRGRDGKLSPKRPQRALWQEEATSDVAKVRRLWTSASGEAEDFNCGISTGTLLPDGRRLMVVDLDVKGSKTAEPATARERLEQFEAAIGCKLPFTVAASTPSGGGHVYLGHSSDLHVAGRPGIIPGVDIRADGNLVLAPGSEIDAGRYAWRKSCSPTEGVEIADAPQKLLDFIGAGPARDRPPPVEVTSRFEDERSIAAAIEYLKTAEPDAGPGNRHAPLNRIVHALAELGITPPTMTELIDEHWAEAASLTEDLACQVSTMANSRAAAGKPWGEKYPYGKMDVGEIFEPIELAEDNKPEIAVAPMGWPLSSLDDCEAALGAAEENPLIEGLLDKGAVSAWYGASNVGKSFLLAGVGYAVATGADWAGRAVVKGAVLYVAYEGGRRFKRRLAALKAHFGGAPGLPLYLAAPRKGSLYSKAAQAALLAAVVAVEKSSGEKVGLIVIDTLSAARAGGGKAENSNDDMDEVAGILREIAEDTGAHVAAVHHAGKDQAKGMRGGYALECSFDTVMEIGAGSVKNTKQREYGRAKDMVFDLRTVLLPVDGEAMESKAAIVSAVAAGRVAALSADEEWALACFDDVAGADPLGRSVAEDRDWAARMRTVAKEEHARGERATAPAESTLLRLRRKIIAAGHVEKAGAGRVRRAW